MGKSHVFDLELVAAGAGNGELPASLVKRMICSKIILFQIFFLHSCTYKGEIASLGCKTVDGVWTAECFVVCVDITQS